MTIKQRSEVEEKDKWNLSSLFATGKEWEEGVRRLQAYGDEAPSWKGRMAEGRQAFLDTLTWYGNVSILSERVGCYAMLCYSADASDPANVRLYGIASQVLSSLGSALSWFEPELLAIPKDIMEGYLAEKAFAPYRVYLKKELRAKAHVLSETEERLLSMQAECSQTPHLAFSDLTNVDMNFGTINGKPLTQSTYSVFMTDPDRSVRKQAYEQFYSVFEAHQHAIARLYEGSVQEDIFHAKARSFPHPGRERSFRKPSVTPCMTDSSEPSTRVSTLFIIFTTSNAKHSDWTLSPIGTYMCPWSVESRTTAHTTKRWKRSARRFCHSAPRTSPRSTKGCPPGMGRPVREQRETERCVFQRMLHQQAVHTPQLHR